MFPKLRPLNCSRTWGQSWLERKRRFQMTSKKNELSKNYTYIILSIIYLRGERFLIAIVENGWLGMEWASSRAVFMIRRLLVIFVSCRVVPHSVRARKRSRCYVIRGLKLGKVGGGKKRRKKIETKQLCRLINIRRWFFFTNITSRLSNRGIREITILFRRESSNFSHFSFGREKIRYGKERHAVLIRKENTRKKREKRMEKREEYVRALLRNA